MMCVISEQPPAHAAQGPLMALQSQALCDCTCNCALWLRDSV